MVVEKLPRTLARLAERLERGAAALAVKRAKAAEGGGTTRQREPGWKVQAQAPVAPLAPPVTMTHQCMAF